MIDNSTMDEFMARLPMRIKQLETMPLKGRQNFHQIVIGRHEPPTATHAKGGLETLL